MPIRLIWLIFLCLLGFATSAAVSLGHGDFSFGVAQVFSSLILPDQSTTSFVVWELRMPRYLLGILVGAALGMAGAIVQSITRNPLGSPSLMGVTSGAAFAIVLGLVFFDLATQDRLWVGAMGGFIAALLTFSMAWKTRLNPIYLTLSGMSVGLFFFRPASPCYWWRRNKKWLVYTPG